MESRLFVDTGIGAVLNYFSNVKVATYVQAPVCGETPGFVVVSDPIGMRAAQIRMRNGAMPLWPALFPERPERAAPAARAGFR